MKSTRFIGKHFLVYQKHIIKNYKNEAARVLLIERRSIKWEFQSFAISIRLTVIAGEANKSDAIFFVSLASLVSLDRAQLYGGGGVTRVFGEKEERDDPRTILTK